MNNNRYEVLEVLEDAKKESAEAEPSKPHVGP